MQFNMEASTYLFVIRSPPELGSLHWTGTHGQFHSKNVNIAAKPVLICSCRLSYLWLKHDLLLALIIRLPHAHTINITIKGVTD